MRLNDVAFTFCQCCCSSRGIGAFSPTLGLALPPRPLTWSCPLLTQSPTHPPTDPLHTSSTQWGYRMGGCGSSRKIGLYGSER